MRKLNQRGFSVVEGLLIFVIAGIIGGSGYYVYSQNKENSSNETYSGNVIQTDKQDQAQEDTAVEKRYFEFKELGVKIELNDNLEGLTYGKDEGVDALFLTTDKLKGLIDSCGSISDMAISYSFMSLGRGEGKFSQEGPVNLMKQFPDFYISAGYPNGPSFDTECEDVDMILKLMSSYKDSVGQAFETAEEI